MSQYNGKNTNKNNKYKNYNHSDRKYTNKKNYDEKTSKVNEEIVDEVKTTVKEVKTNTDSKNVKIVLIIALVVIVLLSALVSIKGGTAKTKEPSADMAEWLAETSSEKYVVSVIGLSYCGHCANYHPIISALAEEYDLGFFWYDIDKMESVDSETLTNTYEFSEYDGASPYTAVTYAGETVCEHVGEMDEEDTYNFLVECGAIED